MPLEPSRTSRDLLCPKCQTALVKSDQVIERVALPDGGEMVLMRWDEHIAIEVDGRSLMSSHEHTSEDALGRIVCEGLAKVSKPRVLIGGLGLGFTLRAALDVLPATAKVTVAELLPPGSSGGTTKWLRISMAMARRLLLTPSPVKGRRAKFVRRNCSSRIA